MIYRNRNHASRRYRANENLNRNRMMAYAREARKDFRKDKRLTVGKLNTKVSVQDASKRYADSELWISTRFLETGSPDLVVKFHDLICEDSDTESVHEPHNVELKVLGFWPAFIRMLKSEFSNPDIFGNLDYQKDVNYNVRRFWAAVMDDNNPAGVDIQVRCDCQDFVYRFEDKARKGNWLFLGEADIEYTNPNKRHKTGQDDYEIGTGMTNPAMANYIKNSIIGKDSLETQLYTEGPACKHILDIVFNVRDWQDRVVTSISWLLRRPETARMLYDMFG